MRIIPFIITSVITIGLVIALNRQWGTIPPIGKFLSPQVGFWQNAEPINKSFNAELKFPQLKGKAEVYFDERLVPHVFAEHEEDAYFIQGYLHAKFRLWQMDLSARAPAGRLSEVLGKGPLEWDRTIRREGMVYAAERMEDEINKNPDTKMECEAYTAGVNAYIDQLHESQYPLEFKLLNYKPEHWSVLKTALFVKYMAYQQAGPGWDMGRTNTRDLFTKEDFKKLVPVFPDSLSAVIPNTAENPYPRKPAFDLSIPASADSLYFTYGKDSADFTYDDKRHKGIGSNNWAVGPSKTQSGRPILCNDPHLNLTLPAYYYEMQIVTPSFNVYGTSFPGIPSIVFGFNDSIAFGFTNSQRDVADYYNIRFRDSTMNEYWFNGKWIKSTKKIESIKIRGEKTFFDTVAYTVFGPVEWDRSRPLPDSRKETYPALRWTAHDPSNEAYMFYLLNRAKNYNDYLHAIKFLNCPGLNCIFASKSGDIALWHQGAFPAKWKGQGDFIMPGTDSSYMWRGMIPQEENPHMKNPARGFVSSANQLPADSTYPYYLRGSYDVYRGYVINRYLKSMQDITVDDMKKMQADNYNLKAEFSRSVLIKTDESRLSDDEKKYFEIYKQWDNRNDASSKGATVFHVWWRALQDTIWNDEFGRSSIPQEYIGHPDDYTLVESLLRDTAYSFIDNINTPQKETLQDMLVASLKKTTSILKKKEEEGKLEWAKYRDIKISHLIGIEPFSRFHIPVGGGADIINAVTEFGSGPSWRMIVQLTDTTEAYGIYDGGQSGNPGSKYYDNFIDDWVANKYYKLWVMKKNEADDERVKWIMNFAAK